VWHGLGFDVGCDAGDGAADVGDGEFVGKSSKSCTVILPHAGGLGKDGMNRDCKSALILLRLCDLGGSEFVGGMAVWYSSG
jgi:hypothetical protein